MLVEGHTESILIIIKMVAVPEHGLQPSLGHAIIEL